MRDATLLLASGGTERTVSLSSYLSAADAEQALTDAYQWIKSLRNVDVGGQPFRARFTMRGDTLWWFTELYLHKEQVVLDIFRTIGAMDAMIAREQPTAVTVTDASVPIAYLVAAIAAARGVRVSGSPPKSAWWRRRVALDLRARALTLGALATRDRWRRVAPRASRPEVAAFVHRAFWRDTSEDGGAEAYIGPVLDQLERQLGAERLAYVGVGPATNFRDRRWGSAGRSGPQSVVPIERFAPLSALRDARQIWRERYANEQALSGSEALRAAARIRGVDCWPLVREQLAGIAWLQWPWSARAMDEAGAALDALQPRRVLTYAEAGGYGRALVLEARRRGIPSAGLQHGFIYRHWLNYLHEPDEAAGDRPFPAPTLTLLFDNYAAEHLRHHGHFAADRLKVTGSPKLDALVQTLAAVTPDAIAQVRGEANVPPDHAMVLVTTKEREARHVLPALVAAAAALPNVTLVVKPHPAETADAYASVAGSSGVRILSAAAPLAPLMAASRALVTVNSTLALDAAVAGIPALVIGLPNNLSPFVAAGALAGAATPAEIGGLLERILYDEKFRQQLASTRSAFLRDHAIGSDGTSAARSAAAVLELSARGS